MKYIKIFESISSDRRSFKNWSDQLKINFDEDLYRIFIKNRNKLNNKNIFDYKSKSKLIEEIIKSKENVSINSFEKDIRKWSKIGLTYDLLFKDNKYVILHCKDFESERKISSGCNLCTSHKMMYDQYLKNGFYFFNILSLEDNERYFGEYIDKKYTIVSKNNRIVTSKFFKNGNWEVLHPMYENNEHYLFIKICEDILKDKFKDKLMTT